MSSSPPAVLMPSAAGSLSSSNNDSSSSNPFFSDDDFNAKLRNITGILQDKFPSIDVDIPSTGANFLLFMLSLIAGMFWITYITFFNSRLVGKILTRVANHFITDGYVKESAIKIGSLSWSVALGKVMFRDVAYVTTDYTVRVQDGSLIFRWWRPYVSKDVSEDLSHSDTRVSLQLYGFELHVYNRTDVYRDLERKFGFERGGLSSLIGTNKGAPDEDNLILQRRASSDPAAGAHDAQDNDPDSTRSAYILGKNWRDLIPVIKVDLSTAKLVFGNKLLPTTLVLSFEEAHCTYSTKQAGCSLDHFMHMLKVRGENFKVLLAPSPKYTGLRDEAPRFMGEGFVVVSSQEINCYYYMDEPGLVPVTEASRGSSTESSSSKRERPVPEWGLDIRCGRGTDFSYGPWADRQRELIYKFFFPQDYRPMSVTQAPKPGEQRCATQFVVRLMTEYESTFDILFSSKEGVTSATHCTVGQGTNFELRLPWVVGEEGYTSTLTGTLMMMEATTSLQFRELLKTETLEFHVDMSYPLVWNAEQLWTFTFIGAKTSLNFIFAHKWFFQDLLDDWSNRSPPDLLFFVPYTWRFKFVLNGYELVTSTNEYNWIDTSSSNVENAYMGLCGKALTAQFDLPYTTFLPKMVPFNFDISAEDIDLVCLLPETNTSHDILTSLDRNAKIVIPDGQAVWKRDIYKGKWRSFCKPDDGWIDCMSAPTVNLEIGFLYHPLPLPGPPAQAEMSTPEKEKRLLTPLRPAPAAKKNKQTDNNLSAQNPNLSSQAKPSKFEPDSMDSDKCSVKLYVGKGNAYLFGTLIRSFMHLKENLFGEDQTFTALDSSEPGTNSDQNGAMRATKNDQEHSGGGLTEVEQWDPRQYRPLEVVLDISVNNVTAHLMKNCTENDMPCPFLLCEQIGFEMDKKYRETRLQLSLSPVVLRAGELSGNSLASAKTSFNGKRQLKQGHLLLTGLQFRGHAMFSDIDRPLGSDTLEYAWLIEIQCGSLIGRVTAEQLYNVFVGLETFIFLMVDKENVLKHPRPYKLCQHNANQKNCTHLPGIGISNLGDDQPSVCSTTEELKYRLVRFLVDSVDVQIVEQQSTLRVQACPIRMSTCNLHGLQTKQGVTALVKQVQIKQYVTSNFPLHRGDFDPRMHHSDVWIESGSLRLGPVFLEGAMSGGGSQTSTCQQQDEFLLKHDARTKRLWFLWPQNITRLEYIRYGRCGCLGGCDFFGANANGIRFFEPRKSDIKDRLNVGIPVIRRADPGFFQSILHDNQFLVHGYSGFGIVLNNILPSDWPDACQEPKILPHCPDYRTQKSSSSHTSADTPSKHPRYHRSFSGKPGSTPQHGSARRKRSVSSTVTIDERSTSGLRAHDKHPLGSPLPLEAASLLQKASSLTEVPSDLDDNSSPSQIVRTESLVSDVLSFYSLDGDDISSSKISFGLSSPKSLRSLRSSSERKTPTLSSAQSTQYDTASSVVGASSAASPISSTFESAASGSGGSPRGFFSSSPSSPTSGQYDTACSSIGTATSTATASISERTSSAMSFDTPTLQPDSPANLSALEEELEPIRAGTEASQSISRAASSGSFISAVSEHEALDLVNLQVQVSKPITDSPLLMSSYISHLTQLRCSYWNDPVGLLAHEDNSADSKQFLSEFHALEEGFSVIKMREKDGEDHDEEDVDLDEEWFKKRVESSEHGSTSSDYWDISSPPSEMGGGFGSSLEYISDNYAEGIVNPGDALEFASGLSDSNTSKTTLIVKFDGAIDVICCPIVLESLEKTFTSLARTFEALHPVSVVNHLHARSVDRVESKNTLKKEKSLDLQEKLIVEPKEMVSKTMKGAALKDTVDASSESIRTFEKSVSSYVQACLNIPKINVMILQASVVEEICAFSALDRVKDITCVSLLALGIKGTTFQFCKTSQSKKTVQMFLQGQKRETKKKKSGGKYKMSPPDFRQNEPFTFESSETQKEEILLTGSVRKMHAQLRRLRNDSSILQDAAITAVPNHKSKVFFEYVNIPKLSAGTGNILGRSGTPEGKKKAPIKLVDARLGYNMAECGFEGISLKVAKRSSNQDIDAQDANEAEIDEQTTPNTSVRVEDEVNETHIEIEADDQIKVNPNTAPPKESTEDAAAGPEPDTVSHHSNVSAAEPGTAETSPEEAPVHNISKHPSQQQGKRSTASGSAELKTTWFNFAAPPKTPISKKIDFTKLDWNLLSTATPSIDAWLGPIDRIQETGSKCFQTYHQRVGSVMACLMAEALDVAAENFLKLTKYEKLTALSKTLRDDPSCQLCSILLKYMLRPGKFVDIEASLSPKGVPPLTTLRQGIVVLSRQWKNVLYTPILIEYNLRCRSLKNIYGTQMNLEPVVDQDTFQDIEDDDADAEEDEDEDEETDHEFGEEALLLKTHPHLHVGSTGRFQLKNGSIVSDLSASIRAKFSPAHFSPLSDEQHLILLERGGNRASIISGESNEIGVQSTVPNSDMFVTSGDVSPTQIPNSMLSVQAASTRSDARDESLYDWMKRQQSMKQGVYRAEANAGATNEHDIITIQEKTGDTRAPDEDFIASAQPQTKAMHLLDAHIIFEPLLSSLGLMPQQIQNLSLKNLGSNVSFLGRIEEVRVDLIESEIGGKRSRKPPTSETSPAFLCEKVFLQIDFKKVTDINMNKGNSAPGTSREKEMIPLYMTRAQLKRHTSSIVNFSIDVHFISQRVNMPLLRLLNQIVTMHQNAKETSEELKEKRPGTDGDGKETAGMASSSASHHHSYHNRPDFMRHKKSSSGSSTSSTVSVQLRQQAQQSQDMTSQDPGGLPQSTQAPGTAGTVRLSDSSSRRTFQTTPSPSMTMKSHGLRHHPHRPKSFAHKFRPNSRLAVALESPIPPETHDSFILTGAPLEMITEETTLVRCWKTMYNLLELYSTMPTTKTVQSRQSLTPIGSGNATMEASLLSGGSGVSQNQPGRGRVQTSAATRDPIRCPEIVVALEHPQGANNIPPTSTEGSLPKVQTPRDAPRRTHKEVSFAKADVMRQEHTPLIVFGIAKIRRTKLSATLSGLKLSGEIKELQTSLQYKEKIRAPMKGMVEASVIGNMQETHLALFEGLAPKLQTVVKVTVGKSRLIHTSHMWKLRDKNCGSMAVDLVQVEIPQHPVDLHSIVTRGTKELSSTLQEFRGVLQRGRTFVADEPDANQQSPKMASSLNSNACEDLPGPPLEQMEPCEEDIAPGKADALTGTEEPSKPDAASSNLIKPFVMSFQVMLHKLVMSAALLPSLNAEYSMEHIISTGMTGSKAKFVIDLPKHTLSFNTKLQDVDAATEANLPSEASIDLPKVQVSAEYIQQEGGDSKGQATADGTILHGGSYLSAQAEIGELEHCLTTDLLNHLVFVQKVFMREVNEVVQKMSGSDHPVPVWESGGERIEPTSEREHKQLLFSVIVRLKNITITATTPANSGVRFETGTSELHISNRVQNVKKSSLEDKTKIFTKAKVNIKLSLGQFIRDPIYFEAEPLFQQHAYFKTTISLRNAFQGEERESGGGSDLIYIDLNRPLVFVMPLAVDRAILFWLSYKNAWEYWTEQRLNLNKEVLAATEQVMEKVPLTQLTSQLSAQHIGTLFLQLNVHDIGLCIPLSLDPLSDTSLETRGAIVCTVESSSISSCSARSTVSKGKFKDLCIRFTDDFNHSMDDWKPDKSDPGLMNLCLVSEGSYEICSHTEKAVKAENAKWLLNIKWQMTGVDVHVDTNIGKHMSALGHTLTSLTGKEEDEQDGGGESYSVSEDDDFDISSSDDFNHKRKPGGQGQIDMDLPAFIFDSNLDKQVVAKYLEQEINEQAKTIEDLQKLGASEQTVATEMKKLNELQNIASKNFRQDIVEKLRRQKSKAVYIKEKFGLGGGATPSKPGYQAHHHRGLGQKSKSVSVASPTSDEVEFRPRLKAKSSFDEDYKGSPRMSKHSTIEEEDDIEVISDGTKSPPAVRGSSNNSSTPSLSDPRKSLTLNVKQQSTLSHVPAEPNVDFEFDVHIFIQSGKCVLHTVKEDEKRRMKKDKSFSGNPFDSPGPAKRVRGAPNSSSTRLRDMRAAALGAESTTFHIPGLDTRFFYLSKTLTDDDSSCPAPFSSSSASSAGVLRSKLNKKATLTTWMTLQSIPEETIITPTILEFLEQALEPLPTFSTGTRDEEVVNEEEERGSSTDSSSQTGLALAAGYPASFPVDVIVYFHMQSSTFRFSCLPVSRVECMLRLPSLDLVFSSKRMDGEIQTEFEDNSGGSPSTFTMHTTASQSEIGSSVMGGMSITGCLNDFSLYVFHPYGGGRSKRPEEMNFSPLTSEERKDSLSVHVAFVKFHISRSRKLNYDKISLESSHRLAKLLSDKRSMACVRFSTIIDIGSASFKYDMRRLTEILAFPKAWYRRTLVRRLFLGELKTTSFHTAAERESPSTPANHPTFNVPGRKTSVSKEGASARRIATDDNQAKIWIGQTTAHSWETLVMAAINFKELKVHMNMGNVMGNVDWISKDFRSSARLSIASTGHKNMYISLGLNRSVFEAKAGIVGGAIRLGQINTFCQLKEDSGMEPFHKLGVQLDVIEVRFDYMGTSVLMGRISSLNATINDDWHCTDVNIKENSPTMQPAQIFIQGDLSWDQLQVMMSKSTTADILKIVNKLEEFFSQQFKSSKKLFSSLEPGPWAPSTSSRLPTKKRAEEPEDHISHHRHWQRAMRKISGMKIYTLPFKLPEVGSVLGGVFELRGKHISLACFHGINFKAKSWALFSLKDPSISFVSDAQQVPETIMRPEDESDVEIRTNIIQTLSFSLGGADGTGQPLQKAHHGYMATVMKISRSVNYLPPIKNLPEWFAYAFKASELDEVARFPSSLLTEGGGSSTGQGKEREDRVQQRTEEIFALPCLRMDLKTIHVQGQEVPNREDAKPTVDCTFVTDFDNHIYVTTDAEAFFFLHDLITSYVKEKERVLVIQHKDSDVAKAKTKGLKDKDKTTTATPAAAASEGMLQSDFRDFRCNNWHLEPTVRLISWAGGELEPYGVDYILQRLGFAHARTTIPKWLQRGCMDPLDKILSVIVLKTIQLVQEEKASCSQGQQQQQGGSTAMAVPSPTLSGGIIIDLGRKRQTE